MGVHYTTCVHAHSRPTLCDPVDCSPPGSSVHRILQARILELPFLAPGDLPNTEIEPAFPAVPALVGRFFTTQPPGNPSLHLTGKEKRDGREKGMGRRSEGGKEEDRRQIAFL